MKKPKQTYDQVYARGYYAGLRYGLNAEKEDHAKIVWFKTFMFWTTWALLVLNCCLNAHYSFQAGRIRELNDMREYQVRDFLYNQYKAGVPDLTDQMNALGYAEDVLGLQFQRVEQMVDSGMDPVVAKRKVFRP